MATLEGASWNFFTCPSDRMKIARSSKNVLVAFFLIPYLFSRPMRQTRVTGFFLGFTFVTIVLSLFIQFYAARIYNNVASTVGAIEGDPFIGVVVDSSRVRESSDRRSCSNSKASH